MNAQGTAGHFIGAACTRLRQPRETVYWLKIVNPDKG